MDKNICIIVAILALVLVVSGINGYPKEEVAEEVQNAINVLETNKTAIESESGRNIFNYGSKEGVIFFINDTYIIPIISSHSTICKDLLRKPGSGPICISCCDAYVLIKNNTIEKLLFEQMECGDKCANVTSFNCEYFENNIGLFEEYGGNISNALFDEKYLVGACK